MAALDRFHCTCIMSRINASTPTAHPLPYIYYTDYSHYHSPIDHTQFPLACVLSYTQGTVEMSNKPEVFVSRMVCCGEGVWVSFRGSSTLELFHTVTKVSLQHIDIKSTMNSIIKREWPCSVSSCYSVVAILL